VVAVDRVLDHVASLFKGLATLCLFVMVTLNLFNVIWRGVFDQAFGWIFSWTLLLFVWMVFLGFFAYVRANRDVTVDIFVSRLPGPLRRTAGLWACVVGMLMALAILRAAPDLLALQTGVLEGIGLPIWVQSAPLFIATVLVFAHFLSLSVAVATGRTQAFPPPPRKTDNGART